MSSTSIAKLGDLPALEKELNEIGNACYNRQCEANERIHAADEFAKAKIQQLQQITTGDVMQRFSAFVAGSATDTTTSQAQGAKNLERADLLDKAKKATSLVTAIVACAKEPSQELDRSKCFLCTELDKALKVIDNFRSTIVLQKEMTLRELAEEQTERSVDDNIKEHQRVIAIFVHAADKQIASERKRMKDLLEKQQYRLAKEEADYALANAPLDYVPYRQTLDQKAAVVENLRKLDNTQADLEALLSAVTAIAEQLDDTTPTSSPKRRKTSWFCVRRN